MYTRVSMIVRTPRAARVEHTPTEHTTTGKERTTDKAEKPAYICMISGNKKKVQKKV